MSDLFPSRIFGSVEISPCGRYRYELTRSWDASKGAVAFVMLNPSTADAAVDDPTIRRCIGFANAWGFGELRVYNLFALRATEPEALPLAANQATAAGTMDGAPVGPDNDMWLLKAAECRMVVCAWGSFPWALKRSIVVMNALQARCAPQELRCLKLNNDCMPRHPLYIKADAKPVPFKIIKLADGEGRR